MKEAYCYWCESWKDKSLKRTDLGWMCGDCMKRKNAREIERNIHKEVIRTEEFMSHCHICDEFSKATGCLGAVFCINEHKGGILEQPRSVGVHHSGKFWKDTKAGQKQLRRRIKKEG